MSHVMSRAALSVAVFACVLSIATTADAVVAYRPHGEDDDDKNNGTSNGNSNSNSNSNGIGIGNADNSSSRENRSGVHVAVMIGVLIVMLIFSVALAIFVIRARRAAKLTSDGWKNLESQTEKFEDVDLSEPEPVHQPNKNRTTDTWDKYLSMIQSPNRLNSTVGKMKTQNRS